MSKFSFRSRFKFIFFTFFLVTSVANAHISDGHVMIEKEAYALLKAQLAQGDLPDGLAIFQFLVTHGIINDNDEANSAYPDLDLGRQFLSDRQIYHFMANSRYVMKALRTSKDIEEQKTYILKQSLPDCLNLIYTLLREVVENPEGANQAGRGIYVLMHAITDSYSREHTIRDSKTFEIENIKSWKLSRLFWPKAAKTKEDSQDGYADTTIFLHSIAGLADKEWVDDYGQLRPEAKAAAIALKDVLITIYKAMNTTENNVDALVTGYMSKHFKPKNANVENGNFTFISDGLRMPLSYESGYYNNTNVMKLDRYPLFSHMLYVQDGLKSYETQSFGYEVGYHVVPRDAFTSSSFFQRLPYGFTVAANENTQVLQDANFLESIQIKVNAKVGFYLPLRNLVLEPRLGFGLTPFYENDSNFGMITGVDFAFNLGRDNNRKRTKRFAIGYEYDASGLHSYNSILLKIGYNSWQGRVIRK